MACVTRAPPPPFKPTLREAADDPGDARRLKDLQLACEPITVQTVQHNATTIAEHLVLLAEIGNVHVGFCIASNGSGSPDPTFIQVVAVAPPAPRRGVATALLDSIRARASQHDIAFATREDNAAARALTTRFAERIGASLRPVPSGTYRHGDLGTAHGLGYHPWLMNMRKPQSSQVWRSKYSSDPVVVHRRPGLAIEAALLRVQRQEPLL